MEETAGEQEAEMNTDVVEQLDQIEEEMGNILETVLSNDEDGKADEDKEQDGTEHR